MSTAMVSPFIDIDLYQQQNRRNHMVQRSLSFADRKTVGTPITGNSMTVNCQSQTHNMQQNSSSSAYRNRLSSVGSLSPLDSGRYSPESPTQFMPIPTTTTGSPILGNREQNISSSSNNRKLDRSMSEPVTDRNCNNTPHSPISQRGGQQSQNVNSSRYKTELCRPYEETRYCKYGDKCQFAHGQHELRSVARHPKYKTEPCRTFHTIGFCPYGPRCHFIHNEDERKMNQINHLRQQLPVSTSQPQQLTASPPSHNIQRPKALNFSLPLVRDSLGSTADSPPSSVSDGSSPTMSPTFLGEDYNLYSLGASPSSVPPPSAPPTVHHPGPAVSMPPNAFSFNPDLAAALSSMLSPLAVQTDPQTIASLAAGLNAISLNHRNNNDMRDILHLQQQQQQQHQPPSPPESLSGDSSASSSSTCGSPLDVSRGLRLPIFSRLSSD